MMMSVLTIEKMVVSRWLADFRGSHQFRRLAEVSVQSGRHHLAGGFAAPDHGGGIGERSGSGFDGNGFASQRRLVEKDVAIDDPNVGRRKIAHPQMDAIAGNQIRRRAPTASGRRAARALASIVGCAAAPPPCSRGPPRQS